MKEVIKTISPLSTRSITKKEMGDKSAMSIIKDTPIDKLYANFYKGDIIGCYLIASNNITHG